LDEYVSASCSVILLSMPFAAAVVLVRFVEVPGSV